MSIGPGLRGVIAGLVAALAPFSAKAIDRDCRPLAALTASSAAPELLQVGGSGPVHFISDGSDKPQCPDPSLGCRRPERVAPGDLVIVTGRLGAFACATIVGPPPSLHERHGWAPAARLVRVHDLDGAKAEWVGVWRTSFDQGVVIRKRGHGGLSLTGMSTWGGADASRVAEGWVNLASFASHAAPAGDALEFATNGCAARMWRLGPYLVVSDNNRCGGMNATFTGIYRRERPG